MRAFIDTHALIAWVVATDADHQRVVAYLDCYTGKLLTTEWILVESADALCSIKQRRNAIDLIQFIRNSKRLQIIGYKQSVYQSGFDLFASRLDKNWSLTDCISFAVMSEHQVTDALTADHHFEQAGFREVFK